MSVPDPAPSPPRSIAADALPCPWLRLAPSGRIEAVNAALSQVLRERPDGIEGRAFDEWLSRPSLVIYQSVVQPLLRLHGHVSELALTLQAADGSTVDVLLYATRETDSADSVVSVQLVPIRQRRRIEAELLRVKRAADEAPGMVFQLERVDASGWRFPYVSDAVRRLYGCTAEAAARSADAVLERIRPPDREALLGALTRCAEEGGGSFRVLVRVDAPAADPAPMRWHEIQGTARERADGLRQWHGYAKDVTDRVAMQEAVTQAQAIERLARLRTEFMGRVSHELRTPLNGILGFTELLLADDQAPPSPQHRQWLQIIESSGLHLLGIVDQLLDLSKFENGRLDARLEPLYPAAVLREAMPAVERMARERDVTLAFSGADDGAAALADVQHLRQVLINLLSNAVKYNRRGGSVNVAIAAAADEVRIEVADTGIGMTAQQVASLFQPFNRLGAERLAIEGTGLGLVVCKQLVESMHGRLEVRSGAGTGSVFTVVLPASSAAAPARSEPGAIGR